VQLDSVLDLLSDASGLEARLLVTLVVLVVGITVGAFVVPFSIRYIGKKIRLFLREQDIEVDDTVEATGERIDLGLPVGLIVGSLQLLVLACTGLATLVVWGYENVAIQGYVALVAAIPVLGRTIVTLVLAVLAYVGTDILEERISEYANQSERINEHQEGVAFRVLQIVVLVSAVLAALSIWGVNLGGLLVGAGFLGIVVGMAARQTLGSLIAGLVLMFARPFEIGDWVRIGDQQGIVTDITIINTRMRNVSGEQVVMPNDVVSQSTVINRSQDKRLRLSVPVGIDYEADVERAEELAAEATREVSMVLDTPKPSVVPTAFDDSAITLDVRYWISHPSAAKEARSKAAVIREIKSRFDEAEVTIPFPQVTLSERAESAEHTMDSNDGPEQA
jgi:small-conductance mechanosensitive channel